MAFNCPTCGKLMPFGTCLVCNPLKKAQVAPKQVAQGAPVFGQQNLQHYQAPPQVVAPVLQPGQLPNNAVLQISCKRADQLQYTVLNPANTLFVLKGTKLDFRASATVVNQAFSFSAAVWGGTAGAAGQGASKQVTFANNSVAVAQPSTVTLAFGGQNVAINVVTYELRTDVTFADPFNGRSDTHLGVDERLTLRFATTPANLTAAQIGGLRWGFANNGVPGRDTLGVLHDPATNAAPLPAMQTGIVTYYAPVRTYQQGGMPQPRKEVTLELPSSAKSAPGTSCRCGI